MKNNNALFNDMYATYLKYVNPNCTREQFGDILRKPLLESPQESRGVSYKKRKGKNDLPV